MTRVERFRAVKNFQPVDHQTPPGVSHDQYCLYLRLLNHYLS